MRSQATARAARPPPATTAPSKPSFKRPRHPFPQSTTEYRTMKKQTRQVFGQYETRLGQLNDTDNVAKTFSVTPSVQQKLETKMQESSEFLTKVNIIGVTEQEGEKLGLGVSGPIAGRTNTKDKERKTRDLSTLDGTKYRCEQTNFDTHLNYAKLDAWAKFPDFQSRVANAILTRQALDRIVIGFNGV